MYPPNLHQELNYENAVLTMKEFPLATVISVKNNEPVITHMPLVYQENADLGSLIGHIDKNNKHYELLDNQYVDVVFHGPDCYISPTYYSTKQLPTWNYVKVHVKGKATLIKDKNSVMDSLIEMNDFLEEPGGFELNKENEKMNHFIKYIQGFAIEITAWEGKFKLSQDKLKKDLEGAKQALIRKTTKGCTAYIEQVYSKHKNKLKDS